MGSKFPLLLKWRGPAPPPLETASSGSGQGSTYLLLDGGFLSGLVVKKPSANVGDTGAILAWEDLHAVKRQRPCTTTIEPVL